MHFKFEHDFDIDPTGFWAMFFDEEYNAELYRHLKTRDRKVLEQVETEGVLKRAAQNSRPSAKSPLFSRSFVSDLSYVERDTFERAKSEMKVVIETPMLKNRLQFSGLFTVRPLGEGRCRRCFEGDVKVSVPLLGGKMEKHLLDEVRTSYDTAAEMTRGWVAKNKSIQREIEIAHDLK